MWAFIRSFHNEQIKITSLKNVLAPPNLSPRIWTNWRELKGRVPPPPSPSPPVASLLSTEITGRLY